MDYVLKCVYIVLALILVIVTEGCSNNGNSDGPNPIPEPPQNVCTNLIPKSPRGMQCLHCNVPNAKAQANALVDITYKSCVSRPAINFLVGGGFGFNAPLMSSLIEKLSRNGREPHVVFYLTSGPNQRGWAECRVAGFGDCIKPEEFRRKIRLEVPYQLEYRSLFNRLKPLIRQIHEAGGQSFVIAALEDNLDDISFIVMSDLLLPAFEPGIPIKRCRNPCPNCYPGNGSRIPVNHCREDHTISASHNIFQGIVSNDGATALFPGEQSNFNPQFDVQAFRPWLSRSAVMESVAILWIAKYQGLYGGSLPPVDQRNYAMPVFGEAETLLQILRH